MKTNWKILLMALAVAGLFASTAACDLEDEEANTCTSEDGTVYKNVQFQTSRDHCGKCFNACAADQECKLGKCEVKQGPTPEPEKAYKYVMVTDTSDVKKTIEGYDSTNVLFQDLGIDIDAIGVEKAGGAMKWAANVVALKVEKRKWECPEGKECANQPSEAVTGAPDAISNYASGGKEVDCKLRQSDGVTQTYISLGGHLSQSAKSKDGKLDLGPDNGYPYVIVEFEEGVKIENGDKVKVIEVRNCKGGSKLEESGKIEIGVSEELSGAWRQLTTFDAESGFLIEADVSGL